MTSLFIILYTSVSVWGNTIAEERFGDKFCDYVNVFAKQVARNRIRSVPFNRIDDFKYFDIQRSNFLKNIALEIYELSALEVAINLNSGSEIYYEECLVIFND